MQEQKRAPENERNIKSCCLAACSATHFEWAMDVESDGSFLTVEKEEEALGDLATSPSSAVSEGALAPCRDVDDEEQCLRAVQVKGCSVSGFIVSTWLYLSPV